MKTKISRLVYALVMCGSALLCGPGLCSAQEAAAESSPQALRVYEGARNAQINNAFDVATEEWSKFLEDFPDDPLVPRVLYNLGVCHVQQKQWEPAITAFTRVIKDFPKAEDLENVFLNLGWSQYSLAQSGKKELFAEAVKSFTSLLEKFPEGAQRDEALFFLGESYYLQDKKKDATDAYRRLADEFPDSKLRCDALYALGVAHEELEQYEEAGGAYDQFLESCEKHRLTTEVTMRKAETLLQTGFVDDAEQLFGEVAAVADFGSADHARYRQAFCLSRLERYKDAAQAYAKILEQFPQSKYLPDAELAAAREYYRAKDYEQGAKWFTTVLKRGGDNAVEAAHWLCRIHLANKQPADAERLASQVLASASNSGEYYVDLLIDQADAIYEQDNTDKKSALQQYLNIAEKHPDHRLAPQALYNAAFAAFELKQYEQSQKLAEQFLSKYANDSLAPDTHYLVAECAIQKRDYAAAQKQLTALIEAHSDRPERDAWRLRLGLIMQLSGNQAGAITYLEQLLKELKEPSRIAEAHFLIGLCKYQQNDYRAAAEHFQTSIDSSRNWRQAGEAIVYLARCLQKDGKLADAIALLSDLIQQSPMDPIIDQATYRLGEISYAAGSFQEAHDAYEKTISSYPQSTFIPFALYGKGWSEIKLKKYADAVKTFQTLIANHAEHELADDARLALAMAQRQAGTLEAAIAEFDKFLATNPGQPQKSDALYERGLAEAALKQFDKAATTLNSLLEANPKYASADKVRYELAWAYRGLQQNDKALAEFTRLAAEHPDSALAAEAAFHVGEDYYQNQKFDEAIAHYTTAKDKAQDGELKEKAVYKLGWSQYQKKQYETALKCFEEQSSSFPDGLLAGDALFMQGECSFKLERYEPALDMFVSFQQTQQKPSSEQMEMLALLHGGQSASQLKDWEQALQLLNGLIDRFPKSPFLAEALYERGWVQQKNGKLEDAWVDFEKAADDRGTLGARARFMMGEVRFSQKKYPDAIREFQRAMYLYGGEQASAETKNWQAKAGFEAGRCAELLIQMASSSEDKSTAIEEAKKFYSFVTQKHPDNEMAAEAQKRLEALANL